MVDVRDSGDLYEFDPEGLQAADMSGSAESDGLVLLYHLDGFIDAGKAGQQVVEHILSTFLNATVARFDVDRLVDYRARRPSMVFRRDHWATYDAPTLELRLVDDATGTPFLLLSGPEPDVEWERFTAAVRGLVERLGVRMTVNFHGIPMGVPHTRPTGITAHGNRSDLIAGYPTLFDEAEVPGSAQSLLEYRLTEAGHDVLGLAVHVPHYLANATYPPSAIAALEAITSATGLVLPAPALLENSEKIRAEIDRQIAVDDGGLTSEIQIMENRYDAIAGPRARGDLAPDPADLPSADELAARFEQFLAERENDAG
ncbi:proteasome protein [Wenjunlia vitaminophila]|uniref:Proteasome protein n=1 Tax=Wenjunlia vitaminophila TaxID=76728 RepID=A0A0T6LTB3_WENVI|nr:PAC2 family protein [Wenjunlia vitaminophila]KRV49339.1 proteasome protein [Wenjunlia vitaminophila]